jgi:serine/threonine protein kinase
MAASLTPLERPSEAELAEADQSASIPNRPAEMAAFGEYELLEEIGRGGMGIVYKARQRSLNRIVALKMVIPSRLTSSSDLRRFQIEAEAAARLDHPNILSIYEVGEISGQPYYTMKWVEGGSLAKRIADCRLPIGDSPDPRATAASPSSIPTRHSSLITRHSELAGLMLKVAHAVAYAHEHGVLHRDLKPGNILLDTRGEPYVADFGLAKLMEQDTGLTQSQPLVGTPGYAAPEQLQGEARHVTTAADVYSLGAVLYELLTGKPPFRGPTPVETIRQAVDTEVKPPHTLNPAVDRDLETICLKCLNKDPRRRYASAQALAEDLDRWLAAEPILARPIGLAERAWLWCRRKPALAGLSAALILTVVVGTTVAAWRIAAARQLEKLESYYASIGLADRYIKDGSIDRALDLLLKCPAQFRHWEWGYLMAQCHQDILSIPAHTNWAGYSPESLVAGLAFDASGTRLLTHGRDRQLKFWDATEGTLIFALDEPTNPVVGWAFHPQTARTRPGDDQRQNPPHRPGERTSTWVV